MSLFSHMQKAGFSMRLNVIVTIAETVTVSVLCSFFVFVKLNIFALMLL